MPNQITSTGLTTKTQSELLADYTAALQAIYGADINLSSDTPDGQMVNIFIQSVLDNLDLITQVYNSFDPDLAYGNTLDERVAINGIQRKAGTFSTTEITVVTSQSCTLQGLDLYPNAPYTISDNAGTYWYLETTQNLLAGTHTGISFRAKDAGEILSLPNTINIPITIVLGVTSINNPNPATSIGLNEETDAELKVRRQKSVALSTQGFLEGLLAALNNINGITTAQVYENKTSVVDGNGVSGHSIWVIVGGAVQDEDVANAIYQKRNAGCGIYSTGTVTTKSYTINQVDGTPFVVTWDTVLQETLYIKFNVTSIDGVTPPNTALIGSELPNLLTLGVGEKANINEIATLVQQIDPNSLVIYPASSGVSKDNITYFNLLAPTTINRQFATATANIFMTVV